MIYDLAVSFVYPNMTNDFFKTNIITHGKKMYTSVVSAELVYHV